MDRHRLAEERSLAYHDVVAGRLRTEPDILECARARVGQWLTDRAPTFYAREWARILEQSPEQIAEFLRDPGERARELRQSTPFAGMIPPRERWRIWRLVGERIGARS
jgi:hypothetical protein